MALRLSGILMGGVVIVYERKVKLLYEDVTRLLVEINEAWKVKSVADPTVLPKGKSQAKFDIEGDEDEAQGNFAPQEHTEIPSTLILSPPLPEVPQQLIAEPGGVFISDPKKPLILAPACVLGEEWSGMQSDTKLIIGSGSGSRSGRKRDSDDKEEKLPQKKIKDVQPIKQIGNPLIEEDQFSNFLKDHQGEKMLVLKVKDQYAFQIYVPKTNDSKWLRPTVDIKGYSILDNVGTCLLLCHQTEKKFCHYDISSGSKRDLPQIPKKIRFSGDAKGTFEPDGKTILMMHDNGRVHVLVFTPDERGGAWRLLSFPLKSADPVEPSNNEIEGLSLNHLLVWAITKANRIFCISVDGGGSWLHDCHNPTGGPITDACLVRDESNGHISYIGICEGENCCSIRLNPYGTVSYDMVDQREILISNYKGIFGKELEDEESGQNRVKIYAAKHRSSDRPAVEVTLFSGVNADSQVIKICDDAHMGSGICQCTRAWIIG